MLSEDMRRLAESPGEFQTLKPHLLRVGADTIDALVAALEEIRAINDEPTGVFRKRGGTRRGLSMVVADAALALARGGK